MVIGSARPGSHAGFGASSAPDHAIGQRLVLRAGQAEFDQRHEFADGVEGGMREDLLVDQRCVGHQNLEFGLMEPATTGVWAEML